MKKYALPLVLVGLVALQACNQKTADSGEAAATAPAGVKLETTEQRLSYGIALTLGQRMKADNVPMDVDAFSAGLRDALTGAAPRLTQEEITAEMQAYQEKAAAEQQAKQAALADANLAAATAFLAENKAKEGVITTESGLQYQVVREGDGPKPGPEDTVEVNYAGSLIDGTEFDSSYKRGESVTFGVGQVIPGWTEALQLMPVGSKFKLVIPPELGYGAGGAGQAIGPNAALVFDVELISIPSQADAGDAGKKAEAAAAPKG
ncbi:MAG: FKBP-type peptidyl-prolyl cis-trans isomerase [Gammaproteobacteria bacterium]|nr:FKBP-type peptidyl-prolyl cis-trans isomerase [Gammaproteobacteria bacterium]